MNKNKLITTLMAGTMIFSSALPVFATVDETQNVEQEEASTGTTRPAEVLYEQASTFSVTIPKTITLDGETKSSDYNINVKGDISSDKQVSVAPDTSFMMVDQSQATNKKADVEATVTQNETIWSSIEVCTTDGTNKNGSILAEDLSSGSWKGTFTFTIAMEDVATN